MKYYFNEERIAYLESRGKVILNACPGSGKTTTIAQKIIEIENSHEIGKHSGVACLSFTNSAKNELIEAFFQLSGKHLRFPNHISTIDSFINKFITLPFYNLLNRDFKRPKILDHTDILDEIWKLKYKNKKGVLVDGLQHSINQFKAKNNRSVYHLYLPSKIRIESDGSYSVEGKQPANDKVDIEVFQKYCQHIKKYQFTKGLISTGDSAFIALHILKNNPQIANWLSKRFPIIIIDEAQDNSLIQHNIFYELAKNGLKNIELIGDPYQSLYEWRDANPKEFMKKYNDDDGWYSLNLTDNRRSPQVIVDVFSNIRRKIDPVITSKNDSINNQPIYIYLYDENNYKHIISHYETECLKLNYLSNCILVRGNSMKNKLSGNSQLQRPWGNQIASTIIKAKNNFDGKNIKDSINELRALCVSLINYQADYHELKEIERHSKIDHSFNSILFKLLKNLPSLSLTIKEWTKLTQVYLQEKLSLNYELDFKLRNRNSRYFKTAILNDPVINHFTKSYSETNIPINTIHFVKGKSLDSVLVFFNEKKHQNNITFKDICNNNNDFPSEKQRLIYVALSRPKKLLAMAFHSSVNQNEIVKKFGEQVKIISNEELLLGQD